MLGEREGGSKNLMEVDGNVNGGQEDRELELEPRFGCNWKGAQSRGTEFFTSG